MKLQPFGLVGRSRGLMGFRLDRLDAHLELICTDLS